MAEQIINVGTSANDGTGDNIRTAFTKAKENFAELYAGAGSDVTLSGTQTLTNKTMSGAANTFSNIPASAIVAGDVEEFDPDTKANLSGATFTGPVAATALTAAAIKITGGTPGAGKVITSDADGDGTWELAVGGSASMAQRRANKYEFFADFLNLPLTGGAAAPGSDEIAAIISAGGVISLETSLAALSANRPGILIMSTGASSAAAYCSLGLGLSKIKCGGGAWIYETDIRLPTLSTSGERYIIKIGLYNDIASATQLDAVSFIYDEGGVSTGSAASANWQLCTASNNTRTFTTTSTAVAINTWMKLRIEVNAAATSAAFYIDTVLVGTHTTNIPGTTRVVGIAAGIHKAVGTAARLFDIDYISAELTFTTPR